MHPAHGFQAAFYGNKGSLKISKTPQPSPSSLCKQRSQIRYNFPPFSIPSTP
ncbi:hypothetical protein [Kingella oralis]|uniref:hypothetical protein n=1 Tax=Kingella oralis TaxID=505 RepID=UPI0034E5D42B